MNVNTPPEPVRAWLESLPAEKRPIIEALRGLIASAAPLAHEIISRDAVWYSPPTSGYPIFYLTVFAAHVNLGFFYGGFVLLSPTGKGLELGKVTAFRLDEPSVEVFSGAATQHLRKLLNPVIGQIDPWMDLTQASQCFLLLHKATGKPIGITFAGRGVARLAATHQPMLEQEGWRWPGSQSPAPT